VRPLPVLAVSVTAGAGVGGGRDPADAVTGFGLARGNHRLRVGPGEDTVVSAQEPGAAGDA